MTRARRDASARPLRLRTRRSRSVRSSVVTLSAIWRQSISLSIQWLHATSELTSELSLEYAISLSRVFATEEQWRTGQTNFFQNLREEAVPA